MSPLATGLCMPVEARGPRVSTLESDRETPVRGRGTTLAEPIAACIMSPSWHAAAPGGWEPVHH
jgi:hypothetical protein